MYSSENEYIDFISQVDTNAAQGNVDEWLLLVESSMIECVHDVTEKSYGEYTKMKRE